MRTGVPTGRWDRDGVDCGLASGAIENYATAGDILEHGVRGGSSCSFSATLYSMSQEKTEYGEGGCSKHEYILTSALTQR